MHSNFKLKIIMKSFRNFISVAIVAAVLITSCKPTDIEVKVSSITLDRATLSLLVDGEYTLTATILPENATNKSVTWTSSNTGVVIVENGKVTAIAVGDATIIAQAGEKMAACEVSVVTDVVEVENIVLNRATLLLAEGETFRLVANVLPVNATNPSVTWTSSDPAVASVDNIGIVTAITQGNVVITAQAGNITATCIVDVLSYYDVLNEYGIHSILYTVDERNPVAIVENEYGLLDSLIVWKWYLCGRGVNYSSGQGFVGSGPLMIIPCLVAKSWRMENGQARGYFIVLGEYFSVNGPFSSTTESFSFEKGWCDVNKFNRVIEGENIPEAEYIGGSWLYYVNPDGLWYYDAYIQGNNFTIDWSSYDDGFLAVMNWNLSLVPIIYPQEDGEILSIGSPINLVNTFIESWRPDFAPKRVIKLNSIEHNKIKSKRINFAAKKPLSR